MRPQAAWLTFALRAAGGKAALPWITREIAIGRRRIFALMRQWNTRAQLPCYFLCVAAWIFALWGAGELPHECGVPGSTDYRVKVALPTAETRVNAAAEAPRGAAERI